MTLVMGKCHICKKYESCQFCMKCGHWFCSPCSSKLFTRAIEAVKEMVGGVIPGCCGPLSNTHNGSLIINQI